MLMLGDSHTGDSWHRASKDLLTWILVFSIRGGMSLSIPLHHPSFNIPLIPLTSLPLGFPTFCKGQTCTHAKPPGTLYRHKHASCPFCHPPLSSISGASAWLFVCQNRSMPPKQVHAEVARRGLPVPTNQTRP